MTEIRQLSGVVPRVETGPLRFGDDWPGVFLRGDQAILAGETLDHLLRGGYLDGLHRRALEELVEVLRSCDLRRKTGSAPWLPKEHGGKSSGAQGDSRKGA